VIFFDYDKNISFFFLQFEN